MANITESKEGEENFMISKDEGSIAEDFKKFN